MIKLTDFQKVVGITLDIEDEQAAQVQRGWPNSERELLEALSQWKVVTGSEISGLDLITVCEVVWRKRPTDLSLAQGRTILYHPAEGTPIAENSPLDGVPLETLAFLKWSIDKGFLRWTDEVTIAREVKAADSVIAELPGDRFYGKNSLPYTPGEEIDWSDLALAQAKDYVANGPRGGTSPGLGSPATPLYLDETTLEGVLLSMTVLKDPMNRDRLLRDMPAGATGTISRSSAPLADIGNILAAVEGFGRLSDREWALNVLIDNAIGFVRGTQKAHQLAAFKR